MKNATSNQRLSLEIFSIMVLTELTEMLCLPTSKGLEQCLLGVLDASLLALIVCPIILWHCRVAASHSVAVKRLFVESFTTLFLTELAIMWVLPILGDVGRAEIEFLDILALSLIAGPILIWRCRAALSRRPADCNLSVERECRFIWVGSVFLMGLSLTVLSVYREQKIINAKAGHEFAVQSDLLSDGVERNIQRTIYGMKGCRSIYAASKSVERLEFRAGVDSRNLSIEFPGVHAFGFIQRVLRPDLEKFIAAERADNAPDFSVKAEGSAPDLYVLKFVEPLASNRAAWGLDLGGDPVLRTAIEECIRTGVHTLSTHRLALQNDQFNKDELLYLLPVYHNGAPQSTPEERFAAIDGVLCAPMLLREVFASLNSNIVEKGLSFEFFAGDQLKATDLLLDSNDIIEMASDLDPRLRDRHVFHEIRSFQAGGRTWTLATHSADRFETAISHVLPWQVGVGELTVTFLLTAVVLLMSGERARVLAQARKMTLNFEATQRDNEALIHTLNLHAIVSFTDVAGNITYVNDTFCKVSGYTREELMGKNHRIVKSGVHDEAFWPAAWKQISSGQPCQAEVCNKAKDGSYYWVHATIMPFLNSEGKVEKYLSIRTDITANKLTELQLKTLIRDLKEQTEVAQQFAIKAGEASAAKSEFLANVSHEIRTPMNGVLGMTELLLLSKLDENQMQLAQTVKRSGEILLTLLNDVLDFSKIEAGKLTLEDVDFDLDVLIDETIKILDYKAREKGLKLVRLIPPEVSLRLRGDPGRLRQILINLIGNATKFSSEGEILVSVSSVSDSAKETVLRFSVKDHGIGIPASKLNKLFQLFQLFSQVDGSFTRKQEGTGLGLAISKQLSQLMGGEIGVNSTEGEGSEFWFTARLSKQVSQELEADLSTAIQKLRLLVVDDDHSQCDVLRFRARSWGLLRSEEASDGLAALSVLRKAKASGDPFHVVVTDLLMPDMDGAALGRVIKAEAGLKNIHLVMLTAHSYPDQDKRMLDIGFAACLTKPDYIKGLYDCLYAAAASQIMGPRRPSQWFKPQLVNKVQRGLKRILVAEDNKINQQVALGLLKKLGYTADVANNGEEALAALTRTDYALVLMDVMMPKMDGLAATLAIRDEKSTARNHQIPIIALTANVSELDRQKCLDAGMDDYFPKPISMPVLEKTLEKWLFKSVPETESATQTEDALKIVEPIFD